jgi:hypothetical protein
MDVTNGEESDRQLRFIGELLEENVHMALDVAQVASNRWAIYGVIPVDGDVIVAEFDTYDEARVLLQKIPTHPQIPDLAPHEPPPTVSP